MNMQKISTLSHPALRSAHQRTTESWNPLGWNVPVRSGPASTWHYQVLLYTVSLQVGEVVLKVAVSSHKWEWGAAEKVGIVLERKPIFLGISSLCVSCLLTPT